MPIIHIKKIDGPLPFTIRWLLRGLGEGHLRFEEHVGDTTQRHSLWLTGDLLPGSRTQLLAAYNEFGCSAYEDHNANQYSTVQLNENINIINCSDTCWAFLMMVADQWCEQMNAILDQEEVPDTLRVLRVTITEVDDETIAQLQDQTNAMQLDQIYDHSRVTHGTGG